MFTSFSPYMSLLCPQNLMTESIVIGSAGPKSSNKSQSGSSNGNNLVRNWAWKSVLNWHFDIIKYCLYFLLLVFLIFFCKLFNIKMKVLFWSFYFYDIAKKYFIFSFSPLLMLLMKIAHLLLYIKKRGKYW